MDNKLRERTLIAIGMEPVNRRWRWHLEDMPGVGWVVQDFAIMVVAVAAAAGITLVAWLR